MSNAHFLTLEQEIAFSQALIDAGIPEDDADSITDCVTYDGIGDETRHSILCSIGNWTGNPEGLLSYALACTDESVCSLPLD